MGRTCDRCKKGTDCILSYIVAFNDEPFDAQIKFIAKYGGQDADICPNCGQELKLKLAKQIIEASKAGQREAS